MQFRRLGYLTNFGQFVINTDNKVPTITMTHDRCPPGYQYFCMGGGVPCQKGYSRHCYNGFPCICIR